jgi:methyltransferase (TIGR00027 family)
MMGRATAPLSLPSVVAAVVVLGSVAQAVEPGLPSKTAVWAAAARAVGAKNPDQAQRNPDYLAVRFLGPRERALLPEYDMAALDVPSFEEAMKRLGVNLPVTSHAYRTRAFDQALIDAVRAGARQVVILGAGFDSRGDRFARELRGVRFMEVDYPPTQEYKKQRVKEVLGALPATVSNVPMDFTKDDLLTQLTKVDYSQREKTFFLWEGVVFYLPEAAVKDTLHFVRDHAAPGSRLAFNYTYASDHNVNNPNSLYARWGEPWLFGFPEDGARPYVRREGLDVLADTHTVQNICVAVVRD